MDRLWAPWRVQYVQGKRAKKCIFCAAAKAKQIRNQVLFKTDHSIALLNIYPYNNGHLMVAPKRHVRVFSRLSDVELLDLMRCVETVKSLLERVLRPDGFNIGINLSEVAGAGIPGHLHIHIVPRWNGDTNFMPVLNGTKIISQSLEELYKRLRHAYAKTNSGIRR
ncbi:MAG TPA: HIT domain-containing protein [Candidatus Omnitrophota bacterium]|nr:HIT domain-containing protein [Candidatus Omnitrophota bacterium]HRZ14867.1 HIT domain-containing protein [Candidatus Omnitrophota bacterium]